MAGPWAITDITGRTVISGSFNTTGLLDVGTLKPGRYILVPADAPLVPMPFVKN